MPSEECQTPAIRSGPTFGSGSRCRLRILQLADSLREPRKGEALSDKAGWAFFAGLASAALVFA